MKATQTETEFKMKFDSSFNEALEKRAQSVLKNPSEVTEEAISVVAAETKEECQGRDVKTWAVMDFAMIRLKIYLKTDLKEEDVIMLKNAKAEIARSPLIGETKSKTNFIYGAV